MFVGPCRGSSGGSLVCYCLGITELDPIKYGTLFERFLDVSRSDWPDIDIDFPDAKRDQVFEYLRDTYGEDHVARLGTISKFGGKSAINDTGKAHGLEYTVLRDVGRAAEGINVPLSVLWYNMPDDLKPLLDANPQIREASLIEGH
ncbi:MAG: DNA polymerase III subunit alpha, partial [Planctomycetota bacterium]